MPVSKMAEGTDPRMGARISKCQGSSGEWTEGLKSF